MTTAAVARPLDWSVMDGPEPYFCAQCWTDFYYDLIDAEALLRTIEHPLRVFTSWGCPRCTSREWDDEPVRPEAERWAALVEIKAAVAMWAGTEVEDEPWF